MFNFKLCIVTLALVSPSVPSQADDEADSRIRITDPEILQSKGYEPDATNVFATPEAFAAIQAASAGTEIESSMPAGGNSELEGGQNQPLGGNFNVSVIHASEFHPIRVTGTTSYGTSGVNERWCEAGPSNVYMGVFRDIPHGAELTVRRVWYYDNSAENITADLVKICLPFFSAGEPEITILRTNTSSGTPGYGRFGPGNFLNEDVDAQSCLYGVRVNLGNAASCAGNQLRILKAALSWQLPESLVFADRFEE